MNLSTTCKNARNHIKKGKTPLAVNLLLSLTSQFQSQNGIAKSCKEASKQLHRISGELSNIKFGSQSGTTSENYVNNRLNNLRIEVLEIIEEIEGWVFTENLQNILMKPDQQIDVNTPINRNISDIEITIDRNFDDFSSEDQKQVLEAIASLLKMSKYEIKIKHKKRGSVKLTLTLDKAKAKELQQLILDGILGYLDIHEASLPNDQKTERNELLKKPETFTGPRQAISVFIAVGHGAVLGLLKSALVQEGDLSFSGSASDKQELINRISNTVDVLLLEILDEPPEFLHLVKKLSEQYSKTRILIPEF